MTTTNMLAPRGRIAERLPGYEPRPEQIEMSRAVAAAFDAPEHLLVEAGTGVGKSFAYLIPAIQRVTQHGGRIVISTHTIALQEQLIEKDIPFLQSVFPEEFAAVLVKGRSNYLGLRRLARASGRQKQLFSTGGELDELYRIEDWAYRTNDGSLSDLAAQPSMTVWDKVRSDGDDCMGRTCPHYKACFYQRARRRANNAQLLIVNHALLFSDIALRGQGASLLPDYDHLVLDEAHTVENVAGDHLGIAVANTQLRYLMNNLHNERTRRGIVQGKANKGMIDLIRRARLAADEYFDLLTAWHAGRRNWNGRLREPPPFEQGIATALIEMREGLREIREAAGDEEKRVELHGMMERCSALRSAIEQWHNQSVENWVYWIEFAERRMRRVSLCGRPIDVGPVLKEALFDRIKSVVLTSATLTNAGASKPFDYVSNRLGIQGTRAVALGSPFNYRAQLTVHVEADMPNPSDAVAYTSAVCEAIPRYLRLTKGRAFVLFTSYDMLQRCAKQLEPILVRTQMPLLVQGSGMPRSLMLAKFRDTPRSVLFGTDTFWAGVDVPGDALGNVIIVKLPFAAPNHPMTEARIEQVRKSGGNAFMEFQVPEAILKFRQGVGRLIRTKTDTGIVVILDSRIVAKPYGRRFLSALPDCPVVVHRRGEAGSFTATPDK